MEEDRLQELFRHQKSLMKRLDVTYSADTLRTLFTAVTVEMAELMQELNWKPWKKQNKSIDINKIREELIDVLFFYLEMCIVLGFDADDIYKAYLEKLKVNNRRIDAGY